MADDNIDDGWDRFCSRAAGVRLMRLAITLWEVAGTKGCEPTQPRLDAIALRLRDVAFTDIGERAFVKVMEEADVDEGAIATAVAEVKAHARKMRGQLALFQEGA